MNLIAGNAEFSNLSNKPKIMNQTTLDRLSTIFGAIAGISTVLGGTGLINQGAAGTIAGLSTAILGYLVQRQPQPSQPEAPTK